MTGVVEMSSVSYRKGGWMRYTLWGVAFVVLIILIITFMSAISDSSSRAIPAGYKFAVIDNHESDNNGNDTTTTTYYVYTDRIMVEDDTIRGRKSEKIIMIYDGINTEELVAVANEANKDCTNESCRKNPKVVAKVKKAISGRVGREYTGLK